MKPMGVSRALRAIAIASLCAAAQLLGSSAAATAFSADQSDLWWNRGESGRGVQLVQRASLIFATMFV